MGLRPSCPQLVFCPKRRCLLTPHFKGASGRAPASTLQWNLSCFPPFLFVCSVGATRLRNLAGLLKRWVVAKSCRSQAQLGRDTQFQRLANPHKAIMSVSNGWIKGAPLSLPLAAILCDIIYLPLDIYPFCARFPADLSKWKDIKPR